MPSDDALQRFCDCFATKDAAAVARIFDSTGLFEFPFIGQRMIGRLEIENAVRCMCDGLRSVSITVTRSRANASFTIAEGELKAVRASSPEELAFPLAIVVEEGLGGVSRLSAYFDTYGQRPWVDGPVFAAG